MSAVLDRVDALLAQADIDRGEAWLQLVIQFAKGELPADEEIARIFGETKKGRKDLERDVALVREYSGLERQLSTVPDLQRTVDELSNQHSAAVKERDAAVEALKAAEQKVSQINSAQNLENMSLRAARQAQQRMNEPKFNLLKGGEPLTARGYEIKEEIAAVEGRLKAVTSRIQAAEQNLIRYEAERNAVDHSDDTTEVKNVQRTKIDASIRATTHALHRAGDEQHDLQRDLRVLRKELAAEKSNL